MTWHSIGQAKPFTKVFSLVADGATDVGAVAVPSPIKQRLRVVGEAVGGSPITEQPCRIAFRNASPTGGPSANIQARLVTPDAEFRIAGFSLAPQTGTAIGGLETVVLRDDEHIDVVLLASSGAGAVVNVFVDACDVPAELFKRGRVLVDSEEYVTIVPEPTVGRMHIFAGRQGTLNFVGIQTPTPVGIRARFLTQVLDDGIARELAETAVSASAFTTINANGAPQILFNLHHGQSLQAKLLPTSPGPAYVFPVYMVVPKPGSGR